MSPWLAVQPETIPTELRVLPWVLWRAEPQAEGKPRKVPYRVAEPRRKAASTDSTTWATFEDAVEAYNALDGVPDLERGPLVGIGVVLTTDAGVSCIDLDHVLDAEGQLDTRAATIVERCNSWTEVSPSRSGLHVFVRGCVPHALKGPQIEVYSDARYIAVTGHRWPGTPDVLRDQQTYLDHLVKVDDAPPLRPWAGPRVPPPDDLAGALLARLQPLGIAGARLKRWSDGYLVELDACPWAHEHTTGTSGAAVMIHASGALDFTCLHAHCGHRGWREFRAVMEGGRR